MRALALVLAAVAALAGCVAPAAEDPAPTPASDTSAEAAPALLIDAKGCEEGGAHSVHPQLEGYLPAPWEPADVLDDVGTPPLTTEWWAHPLGAIPQKGETMGNWHVTVICKEWLVNGEARDLVFGYVGMRVEPPPFDDPANPADRHYLVTVLGASDDPLVAAFHEAGFHATATKGFVRASGPFLHSVLDTADHGIYESIWKPKVAGEMPPGITRLWWQMENEDGTFSPVSLDLATTRAGKHVQADGYGWFSHMGTSDHAFLTQPTNVPPGAAGETPALHWSDFDRVITLGPRPAIKLEEAYIHL